MDKFVDMMNDVLSLSVERASLQAHFVNNGKYVDMTKGHGCDVPDDDDNNAGSLQHGGPVVYQNINANATFKIAPLTMRRK